VGVLSALVAVHAGCAVFRAIVVARGLAHAFVPEEEHTRWKQFSAIVQQSSSRILRAVVD